MTGVLHWSDDGVTYQPLMGGPAGPTGPVGPQGPTGPVGPSEVAVGSAAPTDPATLLWIDEGSNYP